MKLKRAGICIIAVLVLVGSSAWAGLSGSARKLIVGFKAGTPKSVRQNVLKALEGRSLGKIQSNGNTEDEFEAFVIEPAYLEMAGASSPLTWLKSHVRQALSRVSGKRHPSAISDENVLIEEDFRANWIKSVPANFQNTALPSFESVMAALPKVKPADYPRPPKESEGLIPYGIQRLHVPQAWLKNQGEGVVLGVIDTGVYAKHRALWGNVFNGYNAITDSEASGASNDDNGHGTHVAGTMVANGNGIWGVLPKGKVIPVKVLDKDGMGSLSDVIRGIIWCANHDIPVVNMSLGASADSEIMHRAVAYARGRGMVIVAAAGNSGGSVGYPAAYPEAIAVAAIDSDDKLASFSSRGPEVDFVAPGVGIISTWVNGDTKNLRGTSMASPHIAALAGFAVSQGARGIDGPDGVFAALKRASSCLVRQVKDQCYGLVDAARLVD